MKSRFGLATGHGAGAVQALGHDHGTEENGRRTCTGSVTCRLGCVLVVGTLDRYESSAMMTHNVKQRGDEQQKSFLLQGWKRKCSHRIAPHLGQDTLHNSELDQVNVVRKGSINLFLQV